MKHLDKTILGAGAALLLSGGIAAAAVGPSTIGATVMSSLPGNESLAVNNGPRGGDMLATAASYIGITVEQLRTELQGGKTLADVAVAHNKTRDGLIAALTKEAASHIATMVDEQHTFPAGGPGGMRGPGAGAPGALMRFGGGELAAAATYLGVSETDLRTKLEAGQSLAQIAAATSGKSRDGLVAALVTDANAKIDQAQKDGKLTADQATQAKTRVSENIARFVDATHPAGGPGFGRGPGGASGTSGAPGTGGFGPRGQR